VWVQIRDAGQPADSAAGASLGDTVTFSFLTMAIRPRFRVEFTPDDGGTTAVSMLRWVTRHGAVGPWSETSTATVAA
jgi:hypothetical protein